MFGAQEVVTWTFTIVAANVVSLAESQRGALPSAGRCGARGFDRKRNNSIYWPDAVNWIDMPADESQDRITVQAFSQLLYTLHAPSSVLAITVKRAILHAEKMAVQGWLRLSQFRQLVTDYPTLLSPVFLLQTAMRTKLLGEEWWADKRQVFKDARDLVSHEVLLDQRFKLLARHAAKARERKVARAAARAAAGGVVDLGEDGAPMLDGGTSSDSDTGFGGAAAAASAKMRGIFGTRAGGATSGGTTSVGGGATSVASRTGGATSLGTATRADTRAGTAASGGGAAATRTSA